jgi:hypothetical protein
MKYLQDLTWPEVFRGWQAREASNPDWIHSATKVKNWLDWRSWRQYTADQFKANQRKWQLWRFTKPEKEIPKMLVGPYTGWQKRVTAKNQTTFKELLSNKDQSKEFLNNSRIQELMISLPFTTELIGLKRLDTNEIVCIDGHHRSVAITLLAFQDSHNLSSKPITIALADLEASEAHLLDKMLSQGSQNPDQ